MMRRQFEVQIILLTWVQGQEFTVVELLLQDHPLNVIGSDNSLTGKYLSGKLKIEVPDKRRKPIGYIEVMGAYENNLKKLSVNLPLGVLCGVTGVSGSGKSTLMNLTVMPFLKKSFGERVDNIGKHESIDVPSFVRNVIVIDQDPIGRTPRSNPATYTKVFDEIRQLFASTKESKNAWLQTWTVFF